MQFPALLYVGEPWTSLLSLKDAIMDRWTRKVKRNKAPQVREEGREFTNNGAVDYFPVPKIAMIPFKKPREPLYVHSAIGHLRCLKRKSGLHRTRGNRIKKRRQISRQAPAEPRRTFRQPPDESDDMDTARDYVASGYVASDSESTASVVEGTEGIQLVDDPEEQDATDEEEQEACDKVEGMIKNGVEVSADYEIFGLPTTV